MPIAAAIPALIGVAGSVISGITGSSASNTASNQQSSAAGAAAQLVNGVGNTNAQSLTNTANTGAANIFSSGTQANGLLQGLGTSAQPLFQAPDPTQIASNPNYQFILGQGLDALQSSAAGKGLLNSGGTEKDITQFAQGNATNFVNNAFAQALQGYGANSQTQQQNWTNNLNVAGQQGQNLINTNVTGNQLQFAGANAGANQTMAGAQSAGNYLTQQGSAQAAGTLGSNNAFQNALGGVVNYGQTIAGKVIKPTTPTAPVYGPATPIGYDPNTYTGSTP